MFWEYAVEPAVLSSWDRVCRFLDSFGPWEGRFLAEYPKKWKRLVYDGLDCPDMEKHRIIERLGRLESQVFLRRPEASYEAAKPWRQNAEEEHRRLPFRAIIVPSDGSDEFVEAADATGTHPLWYVEKGAKVARTPEAITAALALLLRVSSHIAVVDPYFRAEQGDKLMPLIHLCRAVTDRAPRIDIHTGDSVSYDEQIRNATRAIPKLLPRGTTVTLHCWHVREPEEPGERFHNRFVLTDVGGVQFGDSLEHGNEGQHDRLSILGRTELARHWDELYGDAPVFDLVGDPVQISA